MYGLVKQRLMRLARTPTEPPEAPVGGSVQVFRASKDFLTYRLAGYWIAWCFPWIGWWILLIAMIANREPALFVLVPLLFPVLVALQLVTYFALRLDYDLRYYIVTDRSLRVREGALVVKEMTITHANVQNLRVVQGPLMRFFKIWSLSVDTAGGGGMQGTSSHSVQLRGIENAHEVRDQILELLRKQGGGAGLGDLDDEQRAGLSAGALERLSEVHEAALGLRRAAEGRA